MMRPQEVVGQSEPSLLDESYATSYREEKEEKDYEIKHPMSTF